MNEIFSQPKYGLLVNLVLTALESRVNETPTFASFSSEQSERPCPDKRLTSETVSASRTRYGGTSCRSRSSYNFYVPTQYEQKKQRGKNKIINQHGKRTNKPTEKQESRLRDSRQNCIFESNRILKTSDTFQSF